jgi:hypothetical protein
MASYISDFKTVATMVVKGDAAFGCVGGGERKEARRGRNRKGSQLGLTRIPWHKPQVGTC